MEILTTVTKNEESLSEEEKPIQQNLVELGRVFERTEKMEVELQEAKQELNEVKTSSQLLLERMEKLSLVAEAMNQKLSELEVVEENEVQETEVEVIAPPAPELVVQEEVKQEAPKAKEPKFLRYLLGKDDEG